MPPSPAELASVSTVLADLSARITAMAEAFDEGGRDDIATDLYEVERGLQAAQRRLARIVDTATPSA